MCIALNLFVSESTLRAADNLHKGTTPPVGFEWNSDFGRWRWSDDSEQENFELPSANVGDVAIEDVLGEFDEDELDEFEGYGDDDEE